MLDFVTRAKVLVGDFQYKVWRTKCDRYRVQQTDCGACKSLPFYACVRRRVRNVVPVPNSTATISETKLVWSVLSRHRTKNAAVKACTSHAKSR